MVAPIVIQGGIDIGPGINIGSGTAPPPPSGDNVTGYAQMNPPIIPGNQLEDGTATINGTTGFTINDDGATGIAITALDASNDAWFAANYTSVPDFYSCSWGPGSTVSSSLIQVINLAPGVIVFFVQGQTGPATYNYPFTFGL